jgi:general secretion pathway protein A
LTESETRQYIAHRLRVAGARNEIFNEKAIRKIYSFSKGYPRLINIICDHALLTGYVKDLTTITPKVLKECTKELSLPGEISKKKVKVARPRQKERGQLRKKAVLYSCLLFLLIPLFYPPVSATLKGYFTNVINFYDQLFQQFAGPAHSRDTEESELLQQEKTSAKESALDEQQTQADSQIAAKDISKSVQPLDSKSKIISDSVEQAIDLEDFKLVIPFDYKSNEVPENAYTDLNRAAAAALQDSDVTIVVKGYTDNRGSDTYNRQLSGFRANIVKSYLVGKGVSPGRIKAIGMGEANPLKLNRTEAGRRANRRVEVELVAARN